MVGTPRSTPPGRNFVEWMNDQLARARWTVALYSKAYFDSDWCTTEWTAALSRKTLLPVRLEPVVPPDTLRALTWVDVFDLDEDRARDRLLYAVGLQVLPRLARFPGRSAFPGGAMVGAPTVTLGPPPDPAAILAAALDQVTASTSVTRLAGIRALGRAAITEPIREDVVEEVVAVLGDLVRVPRSGLTEAARSTAREEHRAAVRLLCRIKGHHRLPLAAAQLSGVDLRAMDLSGADLSGADLERANLSSADLSDANLSRANLEGVDLRDARLAWANLTDAYLSGADLSGVDLSSTQGLSAAGLAGGPFGQGDARIDERTVLPEKVTRAQIEAVKARRNRQRVTFEASGAEVAVSLST